tara:strand:- start:121 stop:240 length:120 start_codon:yes stop_codon:yes gene_type:complete
MESRQIVANRLILWAFEIKSNPEVLKFIGIPTTDTLESA